MSRVCTLLKECTSELKVKDKLQFQETHTLHSSHGKPLLQCEKYASAESDSTYHFVQVLKGRQTMSSEVPRRSEGNCIAIHLHTL